MTWTSYYEQRIGSSYLAYAKERYKPFIDAIQVRAKSSICEEGCGIGTISKAIEVPHKELFDIDNGMVALTKLNINGIIYQGDILKRYHSKKFDVIFSHGVLEHFQDGDIKTIVERQTKFARSVLHYVPTDKYSFCSFGTERLLPTARWIELVRPKEVIEFNAGKDLVLII